MGDTPKLKIVKGPSDTSPGDRQIDGRRKRSERSRRQIISAMFDLIEEGVVSPSASDVAERAGVGLRSVFRHFDEMDTLYRDMMQSLEEEVLPKIMVPFQSPDLAGRKAEMVERRTAIFERIMPFKVSAGLRRFQSDFMMDSHLRFRMLERATLKANLPPDVSRDPVQFEAIEAALSFETWRRLRQDQSLEIDAAKAAFARLVDALVPG